MLGLILLFIVLTPGVLIRIPKGKSKIVTACFHAAIFVFIMQSLYIEGFQNGSGSSKPTKVEAYFMMSPTGTSNFYTSDSRITLSSGGVGNVNINSSDPNVKISGIEIHGMKDGSSAWPPDSTLMAAKGYNGTKLVLSKGSLSVTKPNGFGFDNGGTPVKDAKLNIKGMWGTAVWGTQNPNSKGAKPPSSATGGNGNVNTRIRFTVA